MTKVLVGIDPFDYHYITLQPMNDWIRDTLHYENTINGEAHLQQYFVGQNWLPYQSDDHLHSALGDWDSRFFDGTSNQAFHFWYSVASAYYDPDILTIFANIYHDPFYLEKWCGEDLGKFQEMKSWFLRSWANNANGTSPEDFALANKGLQMGHYVANPYSKNIQPGGWIRNNLKAREYRD